ncbi:MAG TPA: 5'/3'-nucleotidase SurE [Bacteroidota bacterium]|nr:5'/3'-nucleotidase SurE [Candidatus Kapabacteria bacterium]HRS01031.1 5'/3'-nucleotidase SurE [Bacteroidota bacterium]HRT67887.1 5'/3'-nucleotidase SurE [Bacteroidota bacterium]
MKNDDTNKPLILVSNDDGINSPGILSLVTHLEKIARVIVVAPDHEQSAVGHSLTLSRPLRVTPFHRDGEMFGFAVSGTPADCVKMALTTLLDERPAMVVSGINHGQNTSINILYSGTVSAVTEGMLFGIPSIAFSYCDHNWNIDMNDIGEIARQIVEVALHNKFIQENKSVLLNVNIPNIPRENIKGIKITRVGNGNWKDYYEKRQDPFGRDYYWFAGTYYYSDEDTLLSDDIAISEGYISITPIKYEFTNFEIMGSLTNFEKIVCNK